jgi:signal transduction histidine kinase
MLSKAETTHGGSATSSFLLRDVVDEIITLLEVVIDERKITVEREGELPGGGVISADRSLIRVALLNVLHNAVKFSHQGSVLRIQYGRSTCDGVEFGQICIENSGPPIPAGDHERVFARFYTGSSSATTGRTGSGLGLSIARLVLDRNGGRIGFDETATSGARCVLTIPMEQPPSR